MNTPGLFIEQRDVPVRLEPFATAAPREVILLDDVRVCYLHWVPHLKARGLCLWPRACPHCGDSPDGDDGDALRAAVRLNPTDDTARLVYADWCDENGHHDRAETLRRGAWWARGPAGDTTPAGFAPALLRDGRPVVAQFTAAAIADIAARPHRGLRYLVRRVDRGAARRMELRAVHPVPAEALPPAFGIEPHLVAWFNRPNIAVARAATEGGVS